MAKPSTGVYILGLPIEDIRRAYFAGEVEKICAEMLALGSATPEDIKTLGETLETLRKEENDFRAKLKAEVAGPLFRADDGKPPGLHDLLSEPTDAERAQFAKWATERDWAVTSALAIIRRHAKDALAGEVTNREKLMTDAHAMTGLMLWLSEDVREKDRLYKRKIIEIIDDYETSRREAQDRAEVTDEYVRFKKAEDLLKLCEAFIQNAKKHYGGSSGY